MKPRPSPTLSQLEGPLFEAVQRARIFADSKTFVDAVARADAGRILEAFEGLRADAGVKAGGEVDSERLRAFVLEWFDVPGAEDSGVAVVSRIAGDSGVAEDGEDSANPPDAGAHIRALWPDLFRPASKPEAAREEKGRGGDGDGDDQRGRAELPMHLPGSSLIPLPHPYVVPGGRFREIYYWDSFFTAQGLMVDGHAEMVRAMVRNFASMVRRFGRIPNGNRLYYRSRSQPPFFAQMVGLLEAHEGPAIVRECLPELLAEWRFWVERRSVRLEDGTRVFRYGDERRAPREESWAEDVETARGVLAEKKEALYGHLRAACESGWDFSSRWLGDPMRLETIRTQEILPVDLNTLLWSMQTRLAGWLREHGQELDGGFPDPEWMQEQADRLGEWIRRELWEEPAGLFADGEWAGSGAGFGEPEQAGEGQAGAHVEAKMAGRTGSRHMGAFYPVAFGLAGAEQARRAVETMEREFLRPGGLVTTLERTGQQWDAPNGWAPLQWIGVEAAARSGREDLAREAARRWTALNEAVFARTGKMLEKYDVEDVTKTGGGGEYPNQDGFGWTNGVFQAFRAQWGKGG